MRFSFILVLFLLGSLAHAALFNPICSQLDNSQFTCTSGTLVTLGASVTQLGPYIGESGDFTPKSGGGVRMGGTLLEVPYYNGAPTGADCAATNVLGGTDHALIAVDYSTTANGLHPWYLCQEGTWVRGGDVLAGGRSGGQTIYGDTSASGNIYIDSTSSSTKGTIYLGAATANENATVQIGSQGTSTAQTLNISTGSSTGNSALNLQTNGSTLALLDTGGTLATPRIGAPSALGMLFYDVTNSTSIGKWISTGSTNHLGMTLTVGQGTTGTDVGKVRVRSGNSSTTGPVVSLDRNGTEISQFTTDGTDTFLDAVTSGKLKVRTGVAGTVVATIDSSGNFRVGDATAPGALIDAVGKFQVTTAGVVTTYNNVAKAENGTPFTVGSASQGPKSTGSTTFSILATSAAADSFYNIWFYAEQTAAGSGGTCSTNATVVLNLRWVGPAGQTQNTATTTLTLTPTLTAANAQQNIVVRQKASSALTLVEGTFTNGNCTTQPTYTVWAGATAL